MILAANDGYRLGDAVGSDLFDLDKELEHDAITAVTALALRHGWTREAATPKWHGARANNEILRLTRPIGGN